MIPASVLEKLAGDPLVAAASRAAFVKTLVFDRSWRALRADYARLYRNVPRRLPSRVSAPDVLLFDCQQSETLPGLAVTQPSCSTDPTVQRVFKNTELLAVFLRECFSRNSIDDCGMALISSIHFSRSYVNAFWTGAQMVYGDGDGLIFKSMTDSDDFIGHELMHGVTQHAAALDYEGEAGALNESLSDIFGSMFRQWKRNWEVTTADWMIGADMMGPVAIQNGWMCLRDLQNPSSPSSLTKQPVHYRDYIQGGGPHDNSGIPNHAFYQACVGVGGKSWEVVGLIWYSAIRSTSITPDIGLKDFAALTCDEASRLFPAESAIVNAVEAGWNAVGLL